MKKSWVLFVASRYIFKGRSTSPVLAVLGIAVGVMALIVIIAVMNGFQLGFIESILEISSYHLRTESFRQEDSQELIKIISSVPGVKSVVPFKESQALARRGKSQQDVILRGLPENACELDKRMDEKLVIEEGVFDISENNILLGSELARRLNLYVGDDVSLFSIFKILSGEDESAHSIFKVTGIFRTGYYEYDCRWALVSIDSVTFLDNESKLNLGIKLDNHFHDKQLLEQINKKTKNFNSIKLSSWRDYNRSFFGALRTEKLFMFILVGLIFIVVGLNIFQAQRRSVLQRREEVGLLRAVGGSQKSVRFVFVLDGAIIGFTGAVIGLCLGLLIATNISYFFTIIENIVNWFINIINLIANYFGAGAAKSFKVFSPNIFYIKEITARILTHEVVLIFMFGFLSALAAAWFASRKIIKIQPAEVLRYE